MVSIIFTNHARSRLRARCYESKQNVEHIIRNEKYVVLSEDRKSNKQDLLFFSNKDYEWYLLVYDKIKRVVITILPAKYRKKNIPSSALQQSRLMVESS